MKGERFVSEGKNGRMMKKKGKEFSRLLFILNICIHWREKGGGTHTFALAVK